MDIGQVINRATGTVCTYGGIWHKAEGPEGESWETWQDTSSESKEVGGEDERHLTHLDSLQFLLEAQHG